MKKNKNRHDMWVKRLLEIYKTISRSDILKAGVVYVDIARYEEQLYFYKRNNVALAEFPDFLSDYQIGLMFQLMDYVYRKGIEVGLRESRKIVSKQLHCLKDGFAHLSNEEVLWSSMEGILSAYISTAEQEHPIEKTEFTEMMALLADNHATMDSLDPDTFICSKFDNSFSGDNRYFDFSPEKVITTLNWLIEHPKNAVLEKHYPAS